VGVVVLVVSRYILMLRLQISNSHAFKFVNVTRPTQNTVEISEHREHGIFDDVTIIYEIV